MFDKIKKFFKRFKNTDDYESACEYDLKTNKLELKDCTQIQLSYIMDMLRSQVIEDGNMMVLAIKNVKTSSKGDYIEIISTPKNEEIYTVHNVMINEIPTINSKWAKQFLKKNKWINYSIKKEKEVV